jgi:hypothetical protein
MKKIMKTFSSGWPMAIFKRGPSSVFFVIFFISSYANEIKDITQINIELPDSAETVQLYVKNLRCTLYGGIPGVDSVNIFVNRELYNNIINGIEECYATGTKDRCCSLTEAYIDVRFNVGKTLRIDFGSGCGFKTANINIGGRDAKIVFKDGLVAVIDSIYSNEIRKAIKKDSLK